MSNRTKGLGENYKRPYKHINESKMAVRFDGSIDSLISLRQREKSIDTSCNEYWLSGLVWFHFNIINRVYDLV